MKISEIQLLFDYNYWANGLMVAGAEALAAEQLVQPAPFPGGNLQHTLLHVLDAEYGWRYICQQGRIVPDLAEADFPSLASITAFWQTEEAEMRAYLDSLHDGDLDGMVRYELDDGTVRQRVLWHCLVHVVNHGTQHRSECAAILTSLGHSPGNIDMTRFLNERAG